MSPSLASLLATLRTALGDTNVISEGDSLDSFSKDYYWYSPVLRPLLDDKRADFIVRPSTIEELRTVIRACHAARVPLTPRGAGTGNYGQCVPLYGGAVVDLSRMDTIHSVEGGVARAAPGARLAVIETVARAAGWELRCYPSTWMKATIGGFFGGGAGGIGGIRWGGIGSIDTVKSITVLTCEAEPQLLRLEEADARVALRTYGTTGFAVELEMRLAPKQDWEQLAFSSANWDALLDWTDAAARRGTWLKRVASHFQWPIPSYFKPLKKHLRDGEHVSFLMIERSQAEEVIASAAAAGIDCVYRKPLADPPKPPFLSDFTFNHTTLWAMKTEPTITYFQAGFSKDFRRQFALLNERFPGEVLIHLEWGASDPLRVSGAEADPAAVNVGGIPLVFYRSEERLREIFRYGREIGIGIGETHTYLLSEGDAASKLARIAFKKQVDPEALMNPGKVASYPLSPVELAAAAERATAEKASVPLQ